MRAATKIEVHDEVHDKAHDEAHDEAHEFLTDTEHKLLSACSIEPQSTPELILALGYASRTGNFKKALDHLLVTGFLEMTVRDKPRSKQQRYRITAAGRARLARTT